MKILCLGNADNVGIRTYTWLKEAGHDVTLYRVKADEDIKRGNPYFYVPKKDLDQDSKVHLIDDSLLKIRWITLFGNEQIMFVNKNYDVVIITGGFHALLLSHKIKLPKIFIHVGYEIHHYADKFRGFPKIMDVFKNPRGIMRSHFYSALARRSLVKVDHILDWFPPTVAVNKSLGFDNKIIYMSFGEDVQRNRKIMNQHLSDMLNRETKNAKRTFLWFSRLNFKDSTKPIYKGPDLFIKALERLKEQLETGVIIVYMGKHGVEVKEFMKFVSNSPIFPYIRWVEHLEYPDLLSYLSIRNGVLFTDFGDVNAGISGIGRDGYTMGIPMVNSTTDEVMIKQYTQPGIRIYAKELCEIKNAMSLFLEMNDDDFHVLKEKTLTYGQQYIDKDFFLKRLLKELWLLKKNTRKASDL